MDVHEKIFCMSEADLYDSSLKIKDLFKWIDRFYDSFDLEKAFQTADKFDLDVNKRFKALSKGYQSIVKLTAALALNVPYVIGEKTELPQGSHLQITGMNLQKLFIKLTEKGGEER